MRKWRKKAQQMDFHILEYQKKSWVHQNLYKHTRKRGGKSRELNYFSLWEKSYAGRRTKGRTNASNFETWTKKFCIQFFAEESQSSKSFLFTSQTYELKTLSMAAT